MKKLLRKFRKIIRKLREVEVAFKTFSSGLYVTFTPPWMFPGKFSKFLRVAVLTPMDNWF